MNTFKVGGFELINKIIYFDISSFQVMIINRHIFLISFSVILNMGIPKHSKYGQIVWETSPIVFALKME